MKKVIISIILVFWGMVSYAQTNTKLQDPINTSEALKRLDYEVLGESVNSYEQKMTFFLRAWTDLATKAQKYEVLVQFYPSQAVIEKGEWDYVINCLKYIKAEQLKGGLDSEYRFSLKNGITFYTTRGKDGIKMLLPDPTIEAQTIKLEKIDDWVSCLTAAKAKVK